MYSKTFIMQFTNPRFIFQFHWELCQEKPAESYVRKNQPTKLVDLEWVAYQKKKLLGKH